MHQIFDSLYPTLENWSKLGQKTDFWVIYRSFSLTPSYALRLAPQFLRQMKGLMKIHNRGKFHLYSICGSQVINVQMFRSDGISIKLPLLGGLWVLSPPDTAQFWWIFFPEVVSHTSKKLLQQSFKNLYLSRKGTYWKCTFLVHIWKKFTPGKCNTLPKGSFLVKTTSLGLWNKTGSRSERIHRIFSQNF